MPSLYEILDNSHDGEGMAALGREFGLAPTQAQAAVTALLPAFSTGLKQSNATNPARCPWRARGRLWPDAARATGTITANERLVRPEQATGRDGQCRRGGLR
jgi:hypothetical protein